MLGKGLTFGSNGNFGSPEKHVSINFGKSNTKFWLSLHYNADNSCLSGNGKKIFKIKVLTYQLNFALELFLIVLVLKSLEGKCVWFSVDFNSIDKSEILNIHKHLMTNNNIK